MESKFQTSFIPKKSLDDSHGVKSKSPVSLFHIISGFIITVVILISIAAFGYNFYLNKQINEAKTKLTEKEKSFNYGTVEEVVRIDNKLKATENLLNNHTAMSHIFDLIGANTIRNLRFSDFEFNSLSPNRMTVSMKGEARSFGAVAKQEELFLTSSSTAAVFIDPVFSDLNVDEEGSVTFSFLTSINPSFLQYSNQLDQ